MKTKQLANILIKILGLSVFIHWIPGVITGIHTAIRSSNVVGMQHEYWFYPVPSLVGAAIGVFLVLQSRSVADFLFRNEDE